MINNNEMIEMYNDYDNPICLGTTSKDGIGYVLEPKIDGEPNPVSVAWMDIKAVNVKSSVIKNGMIRFLDKEIEEEAYKLLRIKINNTTGHYTREKIENMIINSNDEVLQEIIDITDSKIIDLFNNILVGLENSNAYDISSRVALYIRARKEELDSKVPKTELEVTPAKVIETAVIDEEIEEEEIIEEIEEIEEVKEEKIKEPKAAKKPVDKKTTTKKTTTAKKKTK